MQQATNVNGLNLIVCAMDTDDIPAQPDFPFAFKAGELSALYEGWNIVKYNENVGSCIGSMSRAIGLSSILRRCWRKGLGLKAL